jgi:hypothetical protein
VVPDSAIDFRAITANQCTTMNPHNRRSGGFILKTVDVEFDCQIINSFIREGYWLRFSQLSTGTLTE